MPKVCKDVELTVLNTDNAAQRRSCKRWHAADGGLLERMPSSYSSHRWVKQVDCGSVPSDWSSTILVNAAEKFGTSFMIVRSDIQGNIDRLTTRQQQDLQRYQLLYPIVLDEVAKGDTGSTSCTKGLLWLQRYIHDSRWSACTTFHLQYQAQLSAQIASGCMHAAASPKVVLCMTT